MCIIDILSPPASTHHDETSDKCILQHNKNILTLQNLISIIEFNAISISVSYWHYSVIMFDIM